MAREVEVSQYFPPVIQGIREFREIARAENPELNQLFQEAELRLSDCFIRLATPAGIRRYEKMLVIAPDSHLELEERRTKVLIKWNQQLPYTLRRLAEQLILWSGGEAFTLDISRFTEYELRIEVYNQTRAALRGLKEMTRDMIPANLVLFLYGRYPGQYEVPIRYANAIRIRTQFHPRYNLAYLRLDGSWQLDGTRQLNGYDSGNTLDFYPVGLRMQSGCSVAARVDPKVRIGMTAAQGVGSAEQLGIRAEAVAEPREEPRLKITSVVAQGIDTAQRQRITGETPAEIQTEPAIRLPATVTQEIRTGEQLRVVTNTAVGVTVGAAQHTALQSRQEIRAEETVRSRTESAGDVRAAEQLQVRAGAGYRIETAEYMTKMNLMDGNWKLEGSRKLDGGRYIL